MPRATGKRRRQHNAKSQGGVSKTGIAGAACTAARGAFREKESLSSRALWPGAILVNLVTQDILVVSEQEGDLQGLDLSDKLALKHPIFFKSPLAAGAAKNHDLNMKLVSSCVAISVTLANAQSGTDVSPPAASNASSEIVRMSQFEVTTTQGHGYVATNAASAFKTDESLMDIPQADLVVTNDMITDIGYDNSSDILQYVGLAAATEGNSLKTRGYTIGFPYEDDMPVHSAYQDDAYVDSFEVIKGPAEALYMGASLSGLVLVSTKKPLPYVQDIVTASIDGNGLYRFVGDFTGPVGQLGGVKVGYRLVGVYQKGPTYFQNIIDNRGMIFAVLQGDYHNTTVRIKYNLQDLHSQSNGRDLATPTGLLYTGAGRSQADQPPNDMSHYEDKEVAIEVLQKISDNWENRLSGMFYSNDRYGGVAQATSGYDWGKQIEFFNHRLDNELIKYWTVLDDFQGKYEIGPESWKMKNVDALGFGFYSETDKQQYWTSAPFGDQAMGIPLLPGQPSGTLAVPMNNSAAINAIHVPTWLEYDANPPANEGQMGEVYFSSIYYQHSIEVIPNWLEAIAAFTWDASNTQTISNISTLPWTANTEVPISDWLHRLGLVAHLTKGISLYALDSTTFTPPGGSQLLPSGQLVPSQTATGTELGAKWNFLNGRISGEFAWFRMVTANVSVVLGQAINGVLYYQPIGFTVQEGVDGDAAFQILPGWQLTGAFYAGHDLDTNNNPVVTSYNNAWGVFSRYDFGKTGVFKGLAVGGGVSRIGGYWASGSAIIDSGGLLPATGLIKLHEGTLVNGIINYQVNRHLGLRVNCNNILDQAYPLAAQNAVDLDPSPPRTWVFEGIYKY